MNLCVNPLTADANEGWSCISSREGDPSSDSSGTGEGGLAGTKITLNLNSSTTFPSSLLN